MPVNEMRRSMNRAMWIVLAAGVLISALGGVVSAFPQVLNMTYVWTGWPVLFVRMVLKKYLLELKGWTVLISTSKTVWLL